MAFTGSPDFDFTGRTGYTPSPDFDFTAADRTYSLTASLSWAQTGAAIAEQSASQQWAQTGVTLANLIQSAQWALAIFNYADLPASQAWAQAGPTFQNVAQSAKWSQSAPVFANLSQSARWGLTTPAFGDLPASQAWALLIPAFADLPHSAQWALTTANPSALPVSQQWALEATAVWTRVVSATAYIFALEQDAEGRAEIPISNFSGQLRSGEPSYLQCSIPNAAAHAETLAAYAAHDDAEMVITAGYRYSDGDYQTTEIARVTLRNIRSDYGAKSSTISLDGIDTRTNASPKAVTLTGASYRSGADSGLVRYRVAMDFSVRPGDTVTVNGETFVVGELSYQVGDSSAQMEVAEVSG